MHLDLNKQKDVNAAFLGTVSFRKEVSADLITTTSIQQLQES